MANVLTLYLASLWQLVLQFYDHDDTGSDDFIGTAEASVSSLTLKALQESTASVFFCRLGILCDPETHLRHTFSLPSASPLLHFRCNRASSGESLHILTSCTTVRGIPPLAAVVYFPLIWPLLARHLIACAPSIFLLNGSTPSGPVIVAPHCTSYHRISSSYIVASHQTRGTHPQYPTRGILSTRPFNSHVTAHPPPHTPNLSFC